jgi:hypothetical protein
LCGKASDPLGKLSAAKGCVHVIKAMPLMGIWVRLNHFVGCAMLAKAIALNLLQHLTFGRRN